MLTENFIYRKHSTFFLVEKLFNIFVKNNSMTITEQYIVDTYSSIFASLNFISKAELLEKLKKSLKQEQKNKDDDFFSSFGAFDSTKSAEEIIQDIKDNRKFNRKEIQL